jgi:hypothetical protein
MRRTIFEMGFSSPVHHYGPVRPSMGLSLTDVSNLFKGVSAPPPGTVPIAPPPAPTILGMDQNTFLMLGAVALGLGLVVVVVAGRKAAKGPKTAPAAKK